MSLTPTSSAPAAAAPGDLHFRTDHLLADLKGHSVRGGAATFAGQGAKFVLQLASTMVLARLLAPADFGLIAMVTAITGFIMVSKDLGLSMATIQRPEITHRQVSTLFWVNVALGILLMFVTLALAPGVAWFYGDPRLIPVTAALSTAFLFGGLTVQHQALLRRQMRLAAVATIDVVAMAAGIVTAIACASAGLGYWALVWMQVATAAATAAGVWIASGWIPGRAVRRSGVRSMLAFGGYLTGFSVVNYFARNADSVLLGRFAGADALGLYSRAYSLLLLPISQITAPMTAVAVPALSQLQSDPRRYRSYYLKAVRVIAYLSFPLVMTMGVLSTEVVALVLGTQWLGAAPIFRILAVTAMFQPIVATVGWIYVSLGQSKRMAAWGAIVCSLIVLSFIMGIRWGPVGVALSYSACTVLIIHPQLAVATRHSPLTPLDIYKVAYRPFFLGLAIALAMVLTKGSGAATGLVLSLFFSGMAALCAATFLFVCWPALRRDLRDILTTVASP